MSSLPQKVVGVPTATPQDVLESFHAHWVMTPGHVVAKIRVRRHETISELLERSDWVFKLPTICVVNGEPVLRAEWTKLQIKATDKVSFLSRPWHGRGGGSNTKAVLGLVAMVALVAVAPWASQALWFGLGFTGLAPTWLAAGLVVGGAFLVNSLIAPKPATPDTSTADQVYSLTAAGNAAKPFNPIPVGYGKLKTFPDFGAQPWSEYIGNDQYLNVLLVIGCGKYHKHQLFIDDTPIWDETLGFDVDFSDTQVAFYDPGDPVTLFPVNVTSSVEVTGQELPDPVPPINNGGWVGGFIANASGTTAKSIAIDLVWPGGLYAVTGDQNNITTQNCPIEVQKRLVNDQGVPQEAWNPLFGQTFTLASRTPQRISVKTDVTPGRFEIRVRRTTTPATSTTAVDNVVWQGLRAFLNGPTSFRGVSTVALRIRASQQLGQESSHKFGLLWTRILPVWDSNTSQFVEQVTRNPQWAFYDVATNTDYGANRPPSKVDFQNIVDAAAAATARGDTFNFIFTDTKVIPDAFDTVLKVTRARHRWSGDVLSTVRDEWHAVPDMLLSDREIIRGTFTIDYITNQENSADSVILEYLEETTWLPAEIQYPPNSDSFTSVLPTRIRIDGITTRQQAFTECAFQYLQSYYRRSNPTLQTEWDGRRLSYGAGVRVQSELPQEWGSSGAVLSRSGNTLTVDVAPDWTLVGQYYVAIRKKDGRLFGPIKCSQGAQPTLIVLDSTDLTSQGGTTALDAARARADGADEPTFHHGVGDKWSQPCIVISGEPNDNKVTLKLVADDIRVHASDLGLVPDITPGPTLFNPKVPQIFGLFASFVQGVAEPRLHVSWAPSAGALEYFAQVSYDAGASWHPIYNGVDTSFSATVELGVLRVRVSAVGTSNKRGAWLSTSDIDPPTIKIGDKTVTIEAFEKGIHDFVTHEFDDVTSKLNDISRRIANYTAEQDATNWLDKYDGKLKVQDLRNNLTSTNAVVSVLQQQVIDDEHAFASYQITVAARFDAVDGDIASATAAILITAESYADHAVATLELQVTTTFATKDALATAVVTTLATAESYADHAVATLFTQIVATFATQDALNTASVATLALAESYADHSIAAYDIQIKAQYWTASTTSSAISTALNSAEAYADHSIAIYDQTIQATFYTKTATDTIVSSAKNSAVSAAQAYADHAVSTYDQSISADVGGLRAQVNINVAAVATLNGFVAASWGVELDVNGYVSGIRLINGGANTSVFQVVADAFQVAWPGVTAPQPVFQIANVGGVAKLAFRGDLYADGSINAVSINAGTLSVIKLSAFEADFGSSTYTGTISTRGSGPRMVMDFANSRLVAYDA